MRALPCAVVAVIFDVRLRYHHGSLGDSRSQMQASWVAGCLGIGMLRSLLPIASARHRKLAMPSTKCVPSSHCDRPLVVRLLEDIDVLRHRAQRPKLACFGLCTVHMRTVQCTRPLRMPLQLRASICAARVKLSSTHLCGPVFARHSCSRLASLSASACSSDNIYVVIRPCCVAEGVTRPLQLALAKQALDVSVG